MKWRKELQLGWRTVCEQNLITNRIMVVWEIPYFIDVVMKFMWNMALNTSNYFIRKNIFVDCLLCFFFCFFIFQKFTSMVDASNYVFSGVFFKFKYFMKYGKQWCLLFMGYSIFLWERDEYCQKLSGLFAHDRAFGEKGERQDQKFNTSSLLQVFFKIAVFKYFAIFTRKHLYWSLILTRLQAWRSAIWLKRDFQHKCFLMNIAKF